MGSLQRHLSRPPYVGLPLANGGSELINVQAESFSMHGPIHQHLLNGGLERLNKLGEDLLEKRESMLPVVG